MLGDRSLRSKENYIVKIDKYRGILERTEKESEERLRQQRLVRVYGHSERAFVF